MAKIRGKEIRGYIYEQKFDQRYVHHLLEILHSIVQFGGQGFAKTTRSAPIKRIQYQPLAQRMEAGDYPPRFECSGVFITPSALFDPNTSFLDILIELLSRYVYTPCLKWLLISA